jgi:hypothetical protein
MSSFIVAFLAAIAGRLRGRPSTVIALTAGGEQQSLSNSVHQEDVAPGEPVNEVVEPLESTTSRASPTVRRDTLDATEDGQPANRATLTIQEGATPNRVYTLHGGITTLGRSSHNDIVLAASTVSRRHCRISWASDAYVLEDLDSGNGTYLNGEQIHTAFLHSSDVIRIGDQTLQFMLDS